ncbi:Holliday junction DNA helicase RuvA [Mycoplasmoides fastidiosum]|uniref:Holliday junction branch migration complex subunit RuvA n=1 Tax=Mycoplasmoides fastidiosum TaxID=92758 RepID=A0ABU0LZM8_9BACT|nr:Holliday junction branch migration protein RuvA [Mycoplasmoides fastidiosum]MDQ0514163.1 Holliday junction DNA helicase RuvA [Mycoplasmoides fastidiosum]UUD37427.1 helix-hairpin-helix domain-containing protein [Mycoplasmoides fastidiosum]
MINYITGKICYVNSKFIILESNWIGYHINISNPQDFEVNTTKRIYINEVIKLNKQTFISKEYYGFKDLESKILFNYLQNVSGVGPKTAMNILKNGSKNLINLIRQNDDKELSRLPGLNSNLASAICSSLNEVYLTYNTKNNDKKNNGPDLESKYSLGDLNEALSVLGYSKDDILNAINAFESDENSANADISTAVAECVKIIANKNTLPIEEDVTDNI